MKKGVRQGCVLSSLLFSLYTEGLAERIRESGLGVVIGGKVLGTLLYADDVILVAEEEDVLQRMLDITYKFGKDFSLMFNTDQKKCGVLLVGNTVAQRQFKLGGEDICTIKKYNYLGVMFDKDGTDIAKDDRIFRANQWWGRLGAMAKFRANKYEVIRGVWKSIAVPGLMYGMDVINWKGSEKREMEKTQNKIGRVALGCGKLVGNEAIRGDMGWSTFEERLMKAKLRYKVRIERMDENRWVKLISDVVGGKSKWKRECANIARDCNLYKTWTMNQFREYEWNLKWSERGNTDYSEGEWKIFIKHKVEEYGLKKWKEGIEKHPTLFRYKEKKCPKMERFYDGSWCSSIYFKARAGALELNTRTYRYNENRSKMCEWCGRMGRQVEESLEHVMVVCEGYDELRGIAIERYKEILGCDITRYWAERDDGGLQFLLGFEDAGWEVIEITKWFLGAIWNERELRKVANGVVEVEE